MTDERKFDLREISKHNTAKSCWVVINDTVYDVTEFLPQHPGGESSILSWAGKVSRYLISRMTRVLMRTGCHRRV